MARNTRQQRRARRREAAAAAKNAAPEQAQAQASASESAAPPRAAAQPARERRARETRPEAAPRPDAHREPRQRGRFVRESYAELKKVEWPGRSQVVAGTVAVIIACVIVGAYLWVADLALQRVVERVLL